MARAEGSLLDVPALAPHLLGFQHERRYGPWRVGAFTQVLTVPHVTDLAEHVGADTGAPALVVVLESRLGIIDGWSAGTGPWRACLDRQGMRAIWAGARNGLDVDEVFRTDEAVRQVLAWTAEGGLAPDVPTLRRYLTRGRSVARSPRLVVDLLTALGVTGSVGAAARPGATPVDAGPLDAALREWVTPVLQDAGFEARGRRCRRADPAGRVLEVAFDALDGDDEGPELSFQVRVGLVPRTWREWHHHDDPGRSPDDVWGTPVLVRFDSTPPAPTVPTSRGPDPDLLRELFGAGGPFATFRQLPTTVWTVDATSSEQLALLEQAVRERAAHWDAGVLETALQERWLRPPDGVPDDLPDFPDPALVPGVPPDLRLCMAPTPSNPLTAVMLLLDREPSPALDDALSLLGGEPLLAPDLLDWVAARRSQDTSHVVAG